MPVLTITKGQNCAQRQFRVESRPKQNRSTGPKSKMSAMLVPVSALSRGMLHQPTIDAKIRGEIGSVARAGRDADPLTPRKAATVAMLCATAQSWNMYIEKLSEKSLPKEN